MDETHFHPALGDPRDIPAADRPLYTSAGFEAKHPPEPGDWLASHPEPGRTFAEFVASGPNRPSGARRTIYLQPLGEFDATSPSLDDLERYAEAFYHGLSVEVLEPLDLEQADITERDHPGEGQRQLLTRDILAELKGRLPDDAYCLVGVTMVDLYPDPTWNFVFGQASLRERVGVYSFARYGSETPEVMLRRSMKVMAHEIGHMFGMAHCPYFECAMNGSNHLEESDARPTHLCPVCLRKLQWSIGFDARGRYRALSQAYLTLGFRADAARARRRAQLGEAAASAAQDAGRRASGL